jgi:hypothetical protein
LITTMTDLQSLVETTRLEINNALSKVQSKQPCFFLISRHKRKLSLARYSNLSFHHHTSQADQTDTYLYNCSLSSIYAHE